MIALDDVLAHLAGVRRTGRGWSARCPGHPDRRASLSIRARDGGGVLIFCFAGCTYAEILRALRLEPGPAGSRASRQGDDVHALALRIARCQRWADPLAREIAAVSRRVRELYRAADALRRSATAIGGPTSAAWEALARAADHERLAFLGGAMLDEVLACSR